MKVTVLTTYYNKGAYVEEAVRSVLASSFTDFELLVVDDASTDGGLDKVRAIGDPRIRILESAVNTGRPAAANRGFAAARGEYIAILDADDMMHPERLARQMTLLDSDPRIAVCGTWMVQFGEATGTMERPLTDELIRSRILQGIPLAYPSCMLRRALVHEHGVRCDPAWRTPGMDHLFLVELGRFGTYANIPEPLTRYRVGEQNMAFGRDLLNDRRLMLAETFRKLGIKATSEEVEYQLVLHGLRGSIPSVAFVKGMRRWMVDLVRQNKALGVLPEERLRIELEDRWENCFHAAADAGVQVGWAHMRLGGRMSVAELYYLLRRWMRPATNTGKP